MSFDILKTSFNHPMVRPNIRNHSNIKEVYFVRKDRMVSPECWDYLGVVFRNNYPEVLIPSVVACHADEYHGKIDNPELLGGDIHLFWFS